MAGVQCKKNANTDNQKWLPKFFLPTTVSYNIVHQSGVKAENKGLAVLSVELSCWLERSVRSIDRLVTQKNTYYYCGKQKIF